MYNNPNFYPTPEQLLIELFNGQYDFSGRILEPSAGKGDIINFIKDKKTHRRSEVTIDAIEKDVNLSNLLMGAGHSVVWNDFLTFSTHKEYDTIVMNPPFDEGAKHILKAIELAEKQIIKNCTIYAIINAETVRNPFCNERKVLLSLLDKYNANVRFKQYAFSGTDSERKTDVEVALITLNITAKIDSKDVYDRYIDVATNASKIAEEVLERSLTVDFTNNELKERLHDIKRYVLEYEAAVKAIKKAYEARIEEIRLIDYLHKMNEKNSFSLYSIQPNDKYSLDQTYLERLDRLRSIYWNLILNTNEIKELLTLGGREKLQKKLEMSSHLEINLVNIEMLIMSLKVNEKDILVDSCVALFEKLTKYHMHEFSRNIHYYNGWKSNNAFKINPKVIYPLRDTYFLTFGDSQCSYEKLAYNVKEVVSDVIRMMKLFNPDVKEEFDCIGTNDFENDYLRFKVFKKGTMHIWFKDKEMLTQFNFVCGQHFNWLPTDEEMEQQEAQEFIKNEFGIIKDPSNLLTA